MRDVLALIGLRSQDLRGHNRNPRPASPGSTTEVETVHPLLSCAASTIRSAVLDRTRTTHASQLRFPATVTRRVPWRLGAVARRGYARTQGNQQMLSGLRAGRSGPADGMASLTTRSSSGLSARPPAHRAPHRPSSTHPPPFPLPLSTTLFYPSPRSLPLTTTGSVQAVIAAVLTWVAITASAGPAARALRAPCHPDLAYRNTITTPTPPPQRYPPRSGRGVRSGRGRLRRHGVGGVWRPGVYRWRAGAGPAAAGLPAAADADAPALADADAPADRTGKLVTRYRGSRTPPTMLKADLEHSWRWRESNPRPSVHHQGFSGRSLLCFSQPRRSRKQGADRLSRCSMSHLAPRPGQAVILLADARHRVEGIPGLTDP